MALSDLAPFAYCHTDAQNLSPAEAPAEPFGDWHALNRLPAREQNRYLFRGRGWGRELRPGQSCAWIEIIIIPQLRVA